MHHSVVCSAIVIREVKLTVSKAENANAAVNILNINIIEWIVNIKNGHIGFIGRPSSLSSNHLNRVNLNKCRRFYHL